VGTGHRDRVTIGLRGLGPALRAHAKTRELTVAAAARSVLAASLDASTSTAVAGPRRSSDEATAQTVKLTLRMRPRAATLLSERARAAGLPYGAYVGTLLDGSPAPALAADHREAVTALGVSTEQLATLSVDINTLFRMLGRGSSAELQKYRNRLEGLPDEVRHHLGLASRLMAELKPAALLSAHRSRRASGSARRLP
jgi:hypothetical protein